MKKWQLFQSNYWCMVYCEKWAICELYDCDPENSLFVEAVNTEEQEYDANWIAQDLERDLESHPCNLYGAVTDNKSTNK